MKNIIMVFIFTMFITGCTSYSTRTMDYDQFYVEQDWHLSSNPLRMHGSTGMDEVRICSRTIDFCLEDRRVGVAIRSGHTYHDDKMIIATNDGRSYFLDARKGTQLKCQNCLNESFLEQGIIVRKLNSLTFNEFSEKIEKVLIKYGDASDFKSAIIEYHPEGAIWTDVAASGEHASANPNYRSFNDTGTMLSWFECEPECTLVQYDIAAKKYTRQKSPCTNIRNLTIIWQGNKAIPKHEKGADRPSAKSYRAVCLNEQGEPYFPLLTYYNNLLQYN